jgi:hypothetical protein
VALNDSRAALGPAGVGGAGSLTVLADGSHSVTTTATAGADTDAAFGAAVAVGVSNSDTTSELLAGGPALSVGGAVDVQANHLNVLATTADSETAGANVGAGVAIGVSVALDGTTARIARDTVAGSNVSVSAISNVGSAASGIAGQNGGFGSLLFWTTVPTRLICCCRRLVSPAPSASMSPSPAR